MGITIRDAGEDELASVEELVMEAYAEYIPRLSEYAWGHWSGSVHETLTSKAGEVIVAEGEGEMLGAVQFFGDVSTLTLVKWPKDTASMRILSVRPSSRCKGIGRKLVEECIRRARRIGSSSLGILTTEHMRDAVQLYESMGFRRYDDIDLSAFLPEEKVEAYRLEL